MRIDTDDESLDETTAFGMDLGEPAAQRGQVRQWRGQIWYQIEVTQLDNVARGGIPPCVAVELLYPLVSNEISTRSRYCGLGIA